MHFDQICVALSHLQPESRGFHASVSAWFNLLLALMAQRNLHVSVSSRIKRPIPRLLAPQSSSSTVNVACHAVAGGVSCVPASLKRNVAHLHADGTDVYVIGVSHVSKISVRQTRELIAAVSPDVVLLELCRERVDLLIPDTNIDQSDPSLPWHAEGARITGLPRGTGWPQEDDLKKLLRVARGDPMIPAVHIEEDMRALLRTGLFSSVSMRPAPPSPAAELSFLVDSQGKLLTCPPMGVIEFAVEPRTLPPLRSLVVEAPGLEPQQAVMWAEEALAVQGTTVDRLMWLRAKLLGSGSGSATVAFEGIERGDVTARLVSGSSPSGTLVTGLEASVEEAPGKWGVGVRPPAAVASDAVRRKAAQVADKVVSAGEGRVAVHSWMPEERMRGKRGSGNSPSGAGIATALTRYYAKYQTAAGEAVGIPGGAVWRAAVEEACVHGAGLILLGDRPTDATRVRLEAGVLNALMGRLLIAGTVVGAALAGGASGVVDWGLAGSAAMGAATLGVGAVVWPLVGPILEVKALSEMGSPDKIEAAVAVPEDLQGNTKMIKLWGEDALIDWPGALGPIITDRDAFMGHVLARLARAESGICPAFVVRPAGSNRVLEYAMPEGSESLASCPAGVGKGRFRQEDVKPKTVVAVVGTAHVGGIVRDWPKTGDLSHIKQLLE